MAKKIVVYTSNVNEVIMSRLLEIRKENELTQKEFAELLGSNIPYIKAVEQGKFSPSNAFLLRFADHFKLSMDWIFGRTTQRSK